jgi:hypothetical protein
MPNNGSLEGTYSRVDEFTSKQESHFLTAKMLKSCSPETSYSSAKGLMTLDE